MKKSELSALEALFSLQIDQAIRKDGMPSLPLQSRAKVFRDLEQQGLVRKVSVVLGGRFPAVVEGWDLTVAGHLAYCMSCEDPKEHA